MRRMAVRARRLQQLRFMQVACRYVQVASQDALVQRRPVPRTLCAAELTLEQAVDILSSVDEVLGQHPLTGLNVMLKCGHFGPYYEHGHLRTSIGKMHDGRAPSLDHAVHRLDIKAEKLGLCFVQASCSSYPCLVPHVWIPLTTALDRVSATARRVHRMPIVPSSLEVPLRCQRPCCVSQASNQVPCLMRQPKPSRRHQAKNHTRRTMASRRTMLGLRTTGSRQGLTVKRRQVCTRT
jgi:hypothetical protein